MPPRRSTYDAFAPSKNPMWWSISDNWNVLEWGEVPRGADPRQEFARHKDRLSAEGWTIEEHSARSASFFFHRAGVRRHFMLRPTDPLNPPATVAEYWTRHAEASRRRDDEPV